ALVVLFDPAAGLFGPPRGERTGVGAVEGDHADVQCHGRDGNGRGRQRCAATAPGTPSAGGANELGDAVHLLIGGGDRTVGGQFGDVVADLLVARTVVDQRTGFGDDRLDGGIVPAVGQVRVSRPERRDERPQLRRVDGTFDDAGGDAAGRAGRARR